MAKIEACTKIPKNSTYIKETKRTIMVNNSTPATLSISGATIYVLASENTNLYRLYASYGDTYFTRISASVSADYISVATWNKSSDNPISISWNNDGSVTLTTNGSYTLSTIYCYGVEIS